MYIYIMLRYTYIYIYIYMNRPWPTSQPPPAPNPSQSRVHIYIYIYIYIYGPIMEHLLVEDNCRWTFLCLGFCIFLHNQMFRNRSAAHKPYIYVMSLLCYLLLSCRCDSSALGDVLFTVIISM